MSIYNIKQKGASKVPLILVVLVFGLGAFFYFKVVPKTLIEQFIQPPAEVRAGESVKLVFNVSAESKELGKATPAPGLAYIFRIEPKIDNATLDPVKGVTDQSGNIDLTLANNSTHVGEITIFVTSEKHGIEKSMLHLKLLKPDS